MKKFLVLGTWYLALSSLLVVIASPLGAKQSSQENEIASLPLAMTIQKIEATYSETPALQAEFTQSTYVPLLEKTITRPGKIFYQKGGKIRIEYAANPMTHYISDGQTLWIVHPKEKNRESYSLKDSGLPEEALKFLTELGELRKYFNVLEDREGKIILKPKRKSTYKQLTCVFDERHYLKEIAIHSLSGNKSHYRFFNLQTKNSLPEKLFKP